MDKCKTCHQAIDGMACDQCGMDCGKFAEEHACGGKYCEPKCAGCSKTETKCSCPPAE